MCTQKSLVRMLCLSFSWCYFSLFAYWRFLWNWGFDILFCIVYHLIHCLTVLYSTKSRWEEPEFKCCKYAKEKNKKQKSGRAQILFHSTVSLVQTFTVWDWNFSVWVIQNIKRHCRISWLSLSWWQLHRISNDADKMEDAVIRLTVDSWLCIYYHFCPAWQKFLRFLLHLNSVKQCFHDVSQSCSQQTVDKITT